MKRRKIMHDEINSTVPSGEKTESINSSTKSAFKNGFWNEYFPTFISMCAILLSLFVKFLPFIATTNGAIVAAAIFLFISFVGIFAATLIQVVTSISKRTFKFDLNYFIICLAWFILLI